MVRLAKLRLLQEALGPDRPLFPTLPHCVTWGSFCKRADLHAKPFGGAFFSRGWRVHLLSRGECYPLPTLLAQG
jgi:hypothetical protein